MAIFFFWTIRLSIGSKTTSDTPLNRSLTAIGFLAYKYAIFLFLETDAESDGFDSPTPELGSLMLMAAGLAGFAASPAFRRG